MNNIPDELNYSVKIVKSWGRFVLPTGKTISEHFNIDGMPFWEIMTPYIALYQVPPVLSKNLPQNNIISLIRPQISFIKHDFLNWIKRRKHKNKKKQSILNSRPIILFLGFNNYMYRDVLEPVAKYLSSNVEYNYILLNDIVNNEPIINSENSVLSQSIWNNWDYQMEKKSKILKIKVNKAINEFQKMNVYSILLNADNEILWPDLKNAFNWLFKFHYPLMIRQVVFAQTFINNYPISAIVSPDIPDPRNRIYALLSRIHQIPLLEVQFGPSGADGVEWQFFNGDYVATWGIDTFSALIKHGVPKEKICITGSPRHDILINVTNEDEYNVKEKFGISNEVIMVLCASTYQQKEYDALSDPKILVSMKQAVFQAADKFKEICLIVKPHPLEDVEETKKIAKKYKNIKFVDSKEDIRNLIKACDVFISFGSTATVDSLIAAKLTICPSFPGWIWSDIFVNSNATLVPNSSKEVLDCFNNFVNVPIECTKSKLEIPRITYLKKLSNMFDGKASERTGKIILELIKNKVSY